MYIILVIVLLLSATVIAFFRQKKFGQLPSGARLEKISRSANYKNGSFQNESPTPDLTEGANFFSVLKEYFFGKDKRVRPVDRIPSLKTDLVNLDLHSDILVWFGHSSYFIQIDGKRILVDPVFSGSASPLPFSVESFRGTDIYSAEEMPVIDYLFISHDHWDHMDYETLVKLKPRVKQVITGLGTGEHLVRWGYDQTLIIEKDWNGQIDLDDGFMAYAVPGRHFSGRGFTRNKALWAAFVLQTPTQRIFLGGDSGYDEHFARIGSQYGPFDLAILENGQYDKSWKYIHMMPDQVLQAANDLHAKRLLPVHSSKFAIANHAWDEPLKKITALGRSGTVSVLTPRIGEAVRLKDARQAFTEWWENIR